MQNFMETTLNYIEENLKAEITPDELAAMASYSTGHFCRLFAEAMGATVASYITKRRLDHALAQISAGRKAIGVVLEYGFDTYAGFYKAFVKMYGCSPKKYLQIYKKSEVIMLSEQQLQTILANWDIPRGLKIEDVSVKSWPTGEIRWQVWKIGDGLFLKTNERSKMVANIRIAKAIAQEGLASEFLPIPTKDGKDYVDGENIYMLTKKVGEPLITGPLSTAELESLEYNDHRKEAPYKLGQAIAKLHRAMKTVQDDVQPWEGNLFQQGKDAIPAIQKNETDISSEFFADYENFGRLYEKLPKQLIHGVLNGDTPVYANGEVVGFKGYETYNLSSPRIYDITWGAGEINTQPIEDYLQVLSQMLKGYDSVSPLLPEEKESVYYVICATYLRGYGFGDLNDRNRRALAWLAVNKAKFLGLV